MIARIHKKNKLVFYFLYFIFCILFFVFYFTRYDRNVIVKVFD